MENKSILKGSIFTEQCHKKKPGGINEKKYKPFTYQQPKK